MIFEQLPREILIEIIYRLRLKSILKLHLTCKWFRNYFDDEVWRLLYIRRFMINKITNYMDDWKTLYLKNSSYRWMRDPIHMRGLKTFVKYSRNMCKGKLVYNGSTILISKQKLNPYNFNYVEIKIKFKHCSNRSIGICTKNMMNSDEIFIGSNLDSWGWKITGIRHPNMRRGIYHNNIFQKYYDNNFIKSGDRVGILVYKNKLFFYLNGKCLGLAYDNIIEPFYFCTYLFSEGDSAIIKRSHPSYIPI